jgi:imidazoleglycerol-phosphate dehydratase
MSKAFALAGARLGYLAADPAVVDALRSCGCPTTCPPSRRRSRAPRSRRSDELLAGGAAARRARPTRRLAAGWALTVADSDANFVLFGPFADRHAVWQGLLDRGVLIRETGAGRLAARERRHAGGERRVPRGAGGGHGMSRFARVQRTTKESDVLVELEIDGTGTHEIDTGVPFFDHMLAQLSKHGLLDLVVRTKGDLEIDAHHTVEDTSLAVGQAIREALGDKAGIRRYGDSLVPLDEALVQCAVDLSGRPYLVHQEPELIELIGSYDTTLTRHIFESIVAESRITLHVNVLAGRNAHHVVESQFKAFARALRDAATHDPRVVGVPSTKGTLGS